MKKFFLITLSSFATLYAFSKPDISKDSANFYLKKAQQLNIARKVWDADKNFQKAIGFDPTDENVRIEYGNYLVDQRKFYPAVEQFGKVLEKNINHTLALQKLTDVNFLLHRWSDVIMYGNKLKENGGVKRLNYLLGKSYYELENYGQAEKFLSVEVDANPTSVEAVSLLGKVYIELSNYTHAIAIYNKALNLEPDNNQMIYELGLLYYTMNKEKEAVKYFELAVEKGYKKDLDVMENMGLAYLGFDLNKGVETLNKVLEMKPGNTEILFQVAQAYFKVEKFDNAAETYKKIYDTDPANTRALYMSGLSYLKKGDKNKGTNICDMAIRIDPSLAQLKTARSVF